MIPRTLFSPEHELFRDQVRRFIAAEIMPHQADWKAAGIVPRSVWHKAGEAGLLCTEAQKRRWLPPMATGEVVVALGMTEPSGGSDVQNMRTTALRDGDGYVINGQKVFVDRCLKLHPTGELDAVDAAMAKLVSTELQGRVMDQCLQLFGGWGYMWEYPIARAFVDARLGRIGGGGVETMKGIIARSMLPKNAKPSHAN